jgi:hypothetical protein
MVSLSIISVGYFVASDTRDVDPAAARKTNHPLFASSETFGVAQFNLLKINI